MHPSNIIFQASLRVLQSPQELIYLDYAEGVESKGMWKFLSFKNASRFPFISMKIITHIRKRTYTQNPIFLLWREILIHLLVALHRRTESDNAELKPPGVPLIPRRSIILGESYLLGFTFISLAVACLLLHWIRIAWKLVAFIQ